MFCDFLPWDSIVPMNNIRRLSHIPVGKPAMKLYNEDSPGRLCVEDENLYIGRAYIPYLMCVFSRIGGNVHILVL